MAIIPPEAKRYGHDKIVVTFHILDEYKFEDIQESIIEFQNIAPIIRFIDQDIRLPCETFIKTKRNKSGPDLFPNRGIHDFFLIADEVNLEKTSRGMIVVEVVDEFNAVSLCRHVLDIIHDKQKTIEKPSFGIEKVRLNIANKIPESAERKVLQEGPSVEIIKDVTE